MNRIAKQKLISRVLPCSLALLFIAFTQLPASVEATRLPPETKKTVLEIYPAGNVRLDGSVELPDGNLMLPLIPGVNPLKKLKTDAIQKFPANAAEPDLIIYENGWAQIKTEKKDGKVTLKFPSDLADATKKRLLLMKLPSDLIVPNGFVLPKSMKAILGDLNVPLLEDVSLMKPELGHKTVSTPPQAYKGAGTFAFVSIKDGTIILMDAKNFSKIAEFPTEGTPSSMTFVDGKLFIADQAKNRILLLDPSARKFLGQIDLPAATAPRGIAAMPNGKWVYVSLSGASEVAVIETENGKVLTKTKVPTGPSRMAVTPDGVYIVLLSVTASELSVISTYNQRVIGSVKVGSVPTCVVVHPSEKTAYVTNRSSNTVSIVDLTKRTVLNTIKTGASPTGIAISPDGLKLYVAHGRDNTIIIYDTKSLQKTNEVKLPLDVDFPHSICLSPDGKFLIVSSQQTDTVGVLDTTTLEFKKQVQLGHTTQEIIWVPAG
ncbi:MAG: beta-propeller fold lactonase family protein [Candidatus Obscuribacterales bacterium]|nr:beta-propeller fold lactonase family protein [Candidatus Obscuribacterales bacterium]